MIRWNASVYLMWLFFLPVIWFLILWARRKQTKKMDQVFGAKLRPYLTSSLSLQKQKWKVWLQLLTLVFFIFSLARPQAGESKQKIKSQGVEVMLLVDVSESMMAEDVKPNRLTQVKAELNKFIDLSAGNKIGLVAFAGSAALLSPLTNDPGALKLYIDSLSTNVVSSQGTNFEEALTTAKEAFERGGASSDDTNKVTRVIVILSDGEDNEEGASRRAKELADSGVRIFTIAYGTEKGAAIPVRDQMGFLKGYKKDRSGQTVISTVHGEALRDLAKTGKGSFYFSSFGGQHMKQLSEDLSKLEQAEFDAELAVSYEERFQIPLFIAIVLAMIEMALGLRRRTFQFWKGRFEVPRT